MNLLKTIRPVPPVKAGALLIALFLPHCAFGQAYGQASDQAYDMHKSMGELLIEDIGIGIVDAVGYAGEPLGWDTEWIYAGAGFAGTAALMAADETLRDFYLRHPPSAGWDEAFDLANSYGTLSVAHGLSAAVYAGGLFLQIDGLRVTGRLLAEGLVFSGLPSLLLQYTFGRSRPSSGADAWTFNWFQRDNEIQSMPSGHAAVAFAMSTVLAGRAGRWWISVPLYGLACLTAASLVFENHHWTSDVVAGAALGIIGGNYALMKEREREEQAAGAAAAGADMRSRLRFSVGAGRVILTWRVM